MELFACRASKDFAAKSLLNLTNFSRKEKVKFILEIQKSLSSVTESSSLHLLKAYVEPPYLCSSPHSRLQRT